MKFSNIILAASILLLDTSFVQGKGNKPGNKGKIANECTVDGIDTFITVDKNVCMKAMGCVVEKKVCVDVTPCDQITNPNKKKCGKNGCVFDQEAGTCEVNPLDLCITTCTTGEEDNNNCCLKECYCSNYNKEKKCEKDSNCTFNQETEVCVLKTVGDTPTNNKKCSKLNQKKCTGNKGVKNGCTYSDGSCSQTVVVGCAVHNGQATECDTAEEGCTYNECTEQCSKEKTKTKNKSSSQKEMVYGIV